MKGNRQGFLSRFIRAQTNPLHRLSALLGTKKKKTPMGVFFFLVPVVGLEPTRYRYQRILSYLLHTEYKRTQPRMEVIDGHQSACNYWLF